jgi:hypothetical protein
MSKLNSQRLATVAPIYRNSPLVPSGRRVPSWTRGGQFVQTTVRHDAVLAMPHPTMVCSHCSHPLVLPLPTDHPAHPLCLSGGGWQYRLCPLGSELTEACFQQTPMPFAGNSKMMMSNGTMLPLNSTFVSEGTLPTGSTWQMLPIPMTRGVKAGRWGPDGYPFAPPCYDPTPPVPLGQGICSGEWISNITMYDQLRVPDVPAGEYVLGFRWDCEFSAQVWVSAVLNENVLVLQIQTCSDSCFVVTLCRVHAPTSPSQSDQSQQVRSTRTVPPAPSTCARRQGAAPKSRVAKPPPSCSLLPAAAFACFLLLTAAASLLLGA